MVLSELAHTLDVGPKWVLNTMAGLRLPNRYTFPLAQQLALARALHEATGMPLSRAFALAKRVLQSYAGERTPIALTLTNDGDVALTVDVYRLLSTLSVRLAAARTTFSPRARGRPAKRTHDALRNALDWGLDLTLLQDNLTKSPEQRLRQLDAMVTFSHRVRRRAHPQ